MIRLAVLPDDTHYAPRPMHPGHSLPGRTSFHVGEEAGQGRIVRLCHLRL
jgi:hypothetical protein